MLPLKPVWLYSFQANKCWDQLELQYKGQEWAEERQIFGSFSKSIWVMSCSITMRWNFIFFSRQGKITRLSVIRIWMANPMCAFFPVHLMRRHVLVTGEDLSFNTFLICAPFYLIFLSPLAASQPTVQIFKCKHQLAQRGELSLRGFYENLRSGCASDCWEVENCA